jgi:hypothetical protein
MTSFAELSKKHSEFKAMTGISVDEFNSLLFYFEKAESESKFTIAGKERERKHVIYRNSPVNCPADRLLFILMYTKQYMTQAVLGLLFETGQPKASMLIHYLAPILSSALRESGSSPCRNMEEINEIVADTCIHDGTERTTDRPKCPKRQKDHCSGKKKTHSVKNCIIANAACVAVFPASAACGRKHDKKISDGARQSLPYGSKLLQDTGFQGFLSDNILIVQPTKKKRGKELTDGEKERNRNISKAGIRIEHIVGSIKRCRIVSEKFRNWLPGFSDMVMEIACALHNFRLKFRPWQKVNADGL